MPDAPADHAAARRGARLGRGALGLVLLATAAGLWVGSAGLGGAAGYAQLGADFMPRLVAALCLLCGLATVGQAARGADADMPADAPPPVPIPRAVRALILPSAGLLGFALLIEPAGFVLAGVLLFVAVARAFGSRRIGRDLLLGIALTAGLYIAFAHGLGLSLPKTFGIV